MQSLIESGAQEANLALSSDQLSRLSEFVAQLIKWNKVYNLTAVRDAEQMIIKHILDSLVVHPHLGEAKSVLDVGTGPGLPGVPLAILNPEIQFYLCDSNGKKTRFINVVKPLLDLNNVTVCNDRVESLQVPSVDIIISRAFSSIANFVQTTQHLRKPDGRWFAMKGVIDQQELSALTNELAIDEIIPLNVPRLNAERHLIVLK